MPGKDKENRLVTGSIQSNVKNSSSSTSGHRLSKITTRRHKQALRAHKSAHAGSKTFSRDDRSSFLRHRSGHALQTGGGVIFAQQTSDSVLGGVTESKMRESRSIADILRDVSDEGDSSAAREAHLKSAYAVAVEEARAHKEVAKVVQQELATANRENLELKRTQALRDKRVQELEEAVAALKDEAVAFETSNDDLSAEVKASLETHA